MRGAYVLVLKLEIDSNIPVGKLGDVHFQRGYYAYVGSAMGGFMRVRRHFKVASGINTTRRWHIDYLLPRSSVLFAVLLPSDDAIECLLARSIGELGRGIPGFGCSDCKCSSHLIFSKKDLRYRVINACNKLNRNESIIIRSDV
jgi:Uri superfamily endonuclease